jgi:serine/threonine-protein kinase
LKACPQCHIRYPTEASYCFVDGAELAPIHDPLIGKTLAGRYVIEDLIGQGGMASVYRATHKLIDRSCAVKVMDPGSGADPTIRERFRREARAAQALGHPNVIEIFEQGELDDGTPYLVMELLSGEPLSALVARGPVPLARAIPVLIQIARGLARAHDLGVVHRDMKPDNVFLCRREDGTDLAKILDFGIARSRGESRLTGAGEIFGTPQYMAPERVARGETGPSVDLYAFGVLAFELVTGRLPFEGGDPATLLIRHMKDQPPSPRSLRPDLPDSIERLLLDLLEKDPRARPVDARRVALDLVAIGRALGVRLPPEPEVDPASSRPPARTLPAIVVERWQRRVEVFEQMWQRAHGSRAAPNAVLEELRRAVEALLEARARSAREQRDLEDLDVHARDGRQRLGFAVDALGLDASRARDEVRSARADLDRCAADGARLAAQYKEVQRELLVWEGRSGFAEPYPQLADAHRRCARSVDDWLAAHAGVRTGREEVEHKERVVSDLDYQIAELRSALASHEQSAERARDAAQRRLVELNARGEGLEQRLFSLAARFCEPLRPRPELAPLFHQLEADAGQGG